MHAQAGRPVGLAPRLLSAPVLMTLIATVALLIAGLLGMHALGGSGGHASGHGGVPIAAGSQHAALSQHTAMSQRTAMSQHAEHEHEHAAEGSGTADCSPECEPIAPAPSDQAALVACVLALMAGLIVLVRPPRVRHRSTERPAPRAPAVASAVLLVPPPPSLTLLSISRT